MERYYHKNIIQGTDEWRILRNGRLTSSELGEFLFTKGRDEYGLGVKLIDKLNRVAAEVYTGESDDDDIQTAAMARGKSLEPLARYDYAQNTFDEVTEVGFVEMGRYLGGSPDALVAERGLAEIKSRKSRLHYAMLLAKKLGLEFKLPPKDKAQCLWNTFICDRDWCDYISYHPTYPEHQRSVVQRIFLDDETREFLDQRALDIEKYIDHTLKSVGSNLVGA